MDRYVALNEVTQSNGKAVYKSALPTDVTSVVTDPIITVDEHTRLDQLAFKFYGKASLWWVIAQANGIVNGQLHVAPGTQLVIPTI